MHPRYGRELDTVDERLGKKHALAFLNFLPGTRYTSILEQVERNAAGAPFLEEHQVRVTQKA